MALIGGTSDSTYRAIVALNKEGDPSDGFVVSVDELASYIVQQTSSDHPLSVVLKIRPYQVMDCVTIQPTYG